MVTKHKAVTKRKRSRSQKFRKAVPGKPQGVIQARVQAVGPERFGIVAVDCAKAGSKWMLVDFSGHVLCQPANVEHNRSAFQLAALTLMQAVEKHDFKDIIVAVEMTSSYHKPPMRAFRGAGFETRLGDQRSHPIKYQSNKKTRVDLLRSLTGEKEQAGCVEGGRDSRDKSQSPRNESQSEPRFFIRGIATPSVGTNRRIQQEKAEAARSVIHVQSESMA